MIKVLNGANRGKTEISWLNSYHSFSFGDYYNPQQMHFSFLRVINEDIVAPNSGFPMHSHQDMEIITYIISGELTHKDSLGNVDSIKPGEVQLMRAGTGITHSEYNFDKNTPVHLLQIWIIPRQKHLAPGYQQKNFADIIKPNQLCKIISNSKSSDSLHIEQDVEIYSAKFNNHSLEYKISQEHKLWLQVVSGNLALSSNNLSAGDGVGITDEELILIQSDSISEFLLFDFAK
jgi:redox-sensitive bicupin YhaK (pirin superfamily)